MEGIIFIIIVIWAIGSIGKRARKTKANEPGRQISPNPAPPVRPGSPEPRKMEPAAASEIKSAPQPVQATAPGQSLRADQPAVLDESDRARADLSEGASRECDHGSVGGSMDITSHAGMGDEFVHASQQVKTQVQTKVKTQVRTQVQTQVKAHVRDYGANSGADASAAEGVSMAGLTAEQMRQAVVMAEILKRPDERFRSRRCAFR